eukprot:Gb_09780 [translate_table: standard]
MRIDHESLRWNRSLAMAKHSFYRLSFCIFIMSSVSWVFLMIYLAPFNKVSRTQNGSAGLSAGVRASLSSGLNSVALQKQRQLRVTDGEIMAEIRQSVQKNLKAKNSVPNEKQSKGTTEEADCNGRYVYMYNLPPKFNELLLRDCGNLSMWTNMCPHIANSGLGRPIMENQHLISDDPVGWFETNQFTAELIFHERMKRYKCLTPHVYRANAFYVPFYAGLDMSRHAGDQNLRHRDRRSIELVTFLRKQTAWKRMWGRDHFMVIGRITWDFLRSEQGPSPAAWGNGLLLLPEVKNMSSLLIEAHPWHENEHGIPYPSYFHPGTNSQVFQWQKAMESKQRKILFSFAGAPRPGLEKASIRTHILDQCSASLHCKMLKCKQGPSVCHKPSKVMRLFTDSVFCLQPQGDSFTRRSIFDSMLAGCIPVFFTEHSAYTQYRWHLPENRTSYSVYISEQSVAAMNFTIEKHLLSFSKTQIQSMRREVIRLIPSFLYADPRHPNVDFRDSFDIAVQSVVKKIGQLKKLINRAKTRSRRSNLGRKSSKLVAGRVQA